MNNFKDFRAAFLHSKFWTHNSLLVPNSKVILNEDFVTWENILRVPAQIKHFKVFWFSKGISGEICIPGQWNYAYIDGKFYHLVKMHSNGFVKGVDEEWFYYNIIYDDWQNDWMNNTFYLKGTLELTGDPKLALEHLHQMSPIIENVNGYRFLNGIERGNVDDSMTIFKPPANPPKEMTVIGMSSSDRIAINSELKAFNEKGNLTPPEDKLLIPFMFRVSTSGNGKGCILKGIHRLIEDGAKVFDVTVESVSDAGQAGKFRNILENLLGSQEIYAVSNYDHRVYSFAKALNPTKWVSEIDLRECTDITILDRLRLVPLYGVENPLPKFTIRSFVDKLCSRHRGPSDYKDDMIRYFESDVVSKLAPILNLIDGKGQKVFRNVTLEKIDRDIIDTKDKRGSVKNPEWRQGSSSRLAGERYHKNFVGDNISRERQVAFVYELNGVNVNISDLSDRQKNELEQRGRQFADNPRGIGIGDRYENYISHYDLSVNRYYISGCNSLVYLPDEYKLVSEDDTTEYLDFTKNINDMYTGFALIPNYDAKSYVLAHKSTAYQNGTFGRLVLDPKNPAYVDRKGPDINEQAPIFPVIFNEITQIEEKDVVLDWKKPSNEFFKTWKFLGKNVPHPKKDGHYLPRDRSRNTFFRYRGAEILSRGYAFMALNSGINSSTSAYQLKHHHGYSQCYGRNYCMYNDYGSVNYPEDYRYTYRIANAQRPECVYTNEKREWRRFHTEMTFPVKTDGFSIIDVLREFDDIPDNFLRGEVINSGIKKGKITPFVRGFKDPNNDNSPGAYLFTKEEEKAIPKNTVVSIYICLRQSGSPEGDAAFDKQAADVYYAKYKRNGYDRLDELLIKLCRYFFLTKWENGGEAGAIPDWIKNMSQLFPATYPKNGDGRSQLALSGFKPFGGRGYMAWTRFFAPPIYDSGDNIAFRVKDINGNLFDLQGSNDWVMARVPNDYNNYKEYYTQGTYRSPATNVDMNTLLAFYYGNLIPSPYIPSISSKNGNFPNDTDNYETLYNPIINKTNQLFNYIPYNNQNYQNGEPSYTNNKEWTGYIHNGTNLILTNFINNVRTFKSKRMINPKEIPSKGATTYSEGNDNDYEFIPFDEEVPPFMIPYLDPDHREGALHGGLYDDTKHITSKSDRMTLYREKLQHMVRYTFQMLESWNTWVKFEGTNGYASIKLNTKNGIPKWDYELFTNEINSFKTKEEKKWNFINHKESDVDVLINTRNELNIYGNKFPLKSRKYDKGEELDIGLTVKPLTDVKQTIAAAGYAVSMNLNDQDILQTFIETPKELTSYSGFSAYEREKLIREIGMRGEEYLYNKEMLEYQKEENKFTNQYEKDWLYKEWKYDVARGATQIVGGALSMATGGAGMMANMANLMWEQAIYPGIENYAGFEIPHYSKATFETVGENPGTFTRGGRIRAPAIPKDVYGRKRYFKNVQPSFKQHNMHVMGRAARHAGRAVGGLGGIVEGALTIAEAYETFNIKDEYRKQKYALAEKKLATEGDILNKRHEFERKNLLDDLGAMSANVNYPQLNANIVYKLYNKHIGIGDIHMVQYYPKGQLLDYIKNYYKEFGYNILVRNFECTGIQNIVNHLRYQFIYEINYPNICVQEMIRARALMGVKVIPGVQ